MRGIFPSNLFISRFTATSELAMVACKAPNTASDQRCIGNVYDPNDMRQIPFLFFFLTIHFIEEEKKIENGSEYSMNGRKKREQEKVSMVSFANAGTDPWAVMIMDFNAGTTVAAME